MIPSSSGGRSRRVDRAGEKRHVARQVGVALGNDRVQKIEKETDGFLSRLFRRIGPYDVEVDVEDGDEGGIAVRMVVEVVEIAYGKGLELGEHVIPIDVRVVQLDQKLPGPLLYAIMGLRHPEEVPVPFRDLDPGGRALQVYLQGGGCKRSFPDIHWLPPFSIRRDEGRKALFFGPAPSPLSARLAGDKKGERVFLLDPLVFDVVDRLL